MRAVTFVARGAAPVRGSRGSSPTPRVVAALGAGVLVSLARSTTFNRDDLDAKIRGRDRVGLLAKARGASGEAWLDVDATNIHEHAHDGEKIQRVLTSTKVSRDHAAPSVFGTVCVRWEDDAQCHCRGHRAGAVPPTNVRGPHRGKGPKGYERSDDRTGEEGCEAIAEQGRIDASDVEVAVSGGIVTLSGTVAQRHPKRARALLVEQERGVDEVYNELRLTRRPDDVDPAIGQSVRG